MNPPSTSGPTGARVVRFDTLDRLAPLAADWDRLARGVPFRSWIWTSTWWHHYGADPCQPGVKNHLFVLGTFDGANRLIGIAPWYLESSASLGRVLRFLGAGEVCSDYLSVLCEPATEDRVAGALADWLTESNAAGGDPSESRSADRWDLLELSGVDARDTAVCRLAEQLAARGSTVRSRFGPSCWQIQLPGRWEEYLARLSRGHRKKIRRTERTMFSTGRAVARSVRQLHDLPRAQEILIDLHQRRRRSLGEPGCFASPRFTAFHREVMFGLLRDGLLRLDWVELDGRPVAAEYHLAGHGVVYAYQSGIDPDALHHSPGRLAHISTLRQAMEEGYRAFDFLRGDEPYKWHWRAEPRPSMEIRVVPARAAARLRHGLWLAGTSFRQWVKNGLRRTEPYENIPHSKRP